MELVDLYDENRVPLGKTAGRYARKGPGSIVPWSMCACSTKQGNC